MGKSNLPEVDEGFLAYLNESAAELQVHRSLVLTSSIDLLSAFADELLGKKSKSEAGTKYQQIFAQMQESFQKSPTAGDASASNAVKS